MFGQRGAKKEVIRTGFFRYPSLVKPWEAHFRGVSRKNNGKSISSPHRNMEGQKTTWIFEKSEKNRKTLFPLTPLQQHEKQKNDIFLLSPLFIINWPLIIRSFQRPKREVFHERLCNKLFDMGVNKKMTWAVVLKPPTTWLYNALLEPCSIS